MIRLWNLKQKKFVNSNGWKSLQTKFVRKNVPDYFKELKEYVKSFEDIIIEEKER